MKFKTLSLSLIFTLASAGSLSLSFGQAPAEKQKSLPAGYTIPIVDLTDDHQGLTTVDRQSGQYLGHPTAVLLEDDKTILCVYPKGHGRGPIVYKKSIDGGKTWSERLPTPENWATSKEVPTIHRVVDGDGKKRLIVWSGLYPARLAVSEDDGHSWSPLKDAGQWGGIVVMGALARLSDGRYASWFHDDGRFFRSKRGPSRFDVYQTISDDGGLTWSEPVSIAHRPDVHLCEPGFIRSPDGKTIALLMRENSRT
ncbi:MAG: sialidase family protein, partial [Planctomycetota bacterium]|nr:sialidase family protein [Planctomycetota bacterium]